MDQVSGLGPFLRRRFSPVELHGLLCRCYGAHILQPLPPLTLGAQEEFYGRALSRIQQEPPNQFFFKELRRCRPAYAEDIREMSLQAGVGIPAAEVPPLAKKPDELARIRLRERFSLFARVKQDLRGDIYTGWDEDRCCEVRVFITPHGDMRSRERCYQDILALSQLPHQNLLQVCDVGLSKDKFYVVSDSLGEPPGSLSDLESISYLHQLLSALEAAHNRDIFHGEFHPEHVLVDGEIARMGGFGFCRLWGKTFSQGEAEDVRELFTFLQGVVEGEPSWLYTLDSPEHPIPTSETLKQWLAEFYVPEKPEEPVADQEEEDAPVMALDAPAMLVLTSRFGDAMASVTLRNAGDGALPVHVRSEPGWLEVLQEWPDPHLAEQKIDIVFRAGMLDEPEGRGRVLFEGPNGQRVELPVTVRKAGIPWIAIGVVLAALLLAAVAV